MQKNIINETIESLRKICSKFELEHPQNKDLVFGQFMRNFAKEALFNQGYISLFKYYLDEMKENDVDKLENNFKNFYGQYGNLIHSFRNGYNPNPINTIDMVHFNGWLSIKISQLRNKIVKELQDRTKTSTK